MASTSSQTPSSSAPTSTPRWDVFLSFRGTDTRHKFTSHLYAALDRHGVGTFKDDPELRSGEVISDALLLAIRKSRSYIVVFSENYASSPWCLDELAEINNCRKTFSRLVVPVFYNIDPKVVRYQTGSFKDAFRKHEIRFSGDVEKVNKWRLALTEVANLSGKRVSENRSEADMVTEIIDEVLLKIDPKTLDVAKYPVGLDSCVKEITTLLSSGTEGVIRFGIYGMAGVGKTTLAKALYNQLLLGGSFKDSCFLANCREVCQTTQGLASLQQTLINDILTSKNPVKVDNVDKGIKLIRARLRYTKVLVAIDDLDHRKQFEYLVGPFASGSVVIITTRDEEMLDKIGVEPRYRYRVYELDDDKSLTLFNHHAFGNAVPNSSFMVMTKEILGRAGGLPLALEVFGSYMYMIPEVGWKSFVKKLQQLPDSTIQQTLLICLDALESNDPMLKEIFLDIACFLVGLGMRSVVELLKTYYSDVDYKIGILKKRCLLTVDDSNKLRMHDLLRDMGRDVSRNNSPKQPEKHSRLWAVEDIHDVLKKHKGTEVIECIIPCDIEQGDSLNRVPFKISTETFKRMVNLRFLFLTDVDIIGSFEQTFEDLRWLLWDECPLTEFRSDFYPQKLVSLALPESKMRTMWGLNKVFENLKDLDMSHSRDLTATPDFTRLPCLETLKLMNCKSLEEVHISVGTLGKLVCLSLPGCKKLKSLPHTLCNLSALKVLDINICKSLEALPVELGNIKSLEEFIASGLSRVSILPDSIGRLSNLVMLSLRENKNLETLPDTICNLSALKVLHIDNCTGLRALPKELGKMENLKHLSMSGLKVSEIPNSIGNLHELVVLLLRNNENLRNLPHNICSLRSLEALYISGCNTLDILPENFGDLTKSEELYDEYAWIKYCESGYYSNYFKPMPLFYAGAREIYSETEPCCIII